MRNVLSLILLFAFIFFTTDSVYAASVDITDVPSNIDKESEFEVVVSINGAASNTTNYLRAAFFSQSLNTSYFGYTFNNQSEWYNGTPSPIDAHKFLQIQINPEGSWSGKLKTKVDLQSAYFKGGGNYLFKVGRYTASGSSVSDWSTEKNIQVQAPLPTPTSLPTPIPTKVPTSIPTLKPSPTRTPTPIKSGTTSFPTFIPTFSPALISPFASQSSVLGISTASAKISLLRSSTPIPTKKLSKSRIVGMTAHSSNVFFLLGGSILIAVCGILGFLKYKNKYG